MIDWFTVGAQVLNFLILIWLMKRFLYQPILHAIDAREERIVAELADADAKKAEAKKERDEFQKKNEEFDQQRATLLSKATDEVKAERQRLLDEARKVADAASATRRDALQREHENLQDEITRRTQLEVFAIARMTLTDLADTELEERICNVFTRKLSELNGPSKASFAEALKSTSTSALVCSSFDLPEEVHTAIQNTINETFSADIPLRFQTSPDLVSGIELSANGQKVAWSIADYLTSLEESVGELLEVKIKTDTRSKPKSKEPEAAAQTQ